MFIQSSNYLIKPNDKKAKLANYFPAIYYIAVDSISDTFIEVPSDGLNSVVKFQRRGKVQKGNVVTVGTRSIIVLWGLEKSRVLGCYYYNVYMSIIIIKYNIVENINMILLI